MFMLKSFIDSLTYDFNTHTGNLFQEAGCCCDMRAAIKLFIGIASIWEEGDRLGHAEAPTAPRNCPRRGQGNVRHSGQ